MSRPAADSSTIRVAQVVRPAEGGIRRHVSLLIGGLDRSNFTSTLYAPTDFALDDISFDVTKVAVDIRPKVNIPRDLQTVRTLTTMLSNGRFDLLHSHGLRAAFIGTIAARRACIPALFTAHNLILSLNSVQRLALTLISRRTEAIIAVSAAVSNGLQACGVHASRIHVIPNGIRFDEYASATPSSPLSLGIDPASAVLAYIGRLSHEKGLDTLLDAYKLVAANKPNAQLLVVGDGPDESSLRSRTDNLPGVHFLGRRSDVPALLKCAELVVVPSYSEGQGIVAIEAMASGRPVVATNVGGLSETIVDGLTGILVPPHDSRALADAIVSLLDDPSRAASMGAAGSMRAMREYSITRMIDSIQDLYRDILTRSNRIRYNNSQSNVTKRTEPT